VEQQSSRPQRSLGFSLLFNCSTAPLLCSDCVGTEGEGFEPSRPQMEPSALAPRRNQPLCQPSDIARRPPRPAAKKILKKSSRTVDRSGAAALVLLFNCPAAPLLCFGFTETEGEGVEPPRPEGHARFRDECLSRSANPPSSSWTPEGIEPSFPGCRPGVFPLDDAPVRLASLAHGGPFTQLDACTERAKRVEVLREGLEPSPSAFGEPRSSD
jgi:hypothetical protein